MDSIFVLFSKDNEHMTKKVCNAFEKIGVKQVYITQTNVLDQFMDNSSFTSSSNSIIDSMLKCNMVITIVTESSLNSNSMQIFLGAAILNKKSLLVIMIGNTMLPSYIRQYNHIEYHATNEENFSIADFTNFVQDRVFPKEEPTSTFTKKKKNRPGRPDYSKEINIIKGALNENRLTLVCGAGVSTSAGLPDWYTLLARMFEIALSDTNFSVNEIKSLFSNSQLIIAKYLRILLQDKFDHVLYTSLYSSEDINESLLIKAIIELARPKRNSKSIESIITFNFDSIIEDCLDKYSLQYKVICDEGIKITMDELPIYHVHGFLPRHSSTYDISVGNGSIDRHNIVFSEDGYHTQFIDPYSWSNLIQLYKFMNNVCLFIGISLTDPNLRRLLDISKRKNSDKNARHFIIKKEPKDEIPMREMQKMLEEQDALMLGLNLIWVKDYDEIPSLLSSLQA